MPFTAAASAFISPRIGAVTKCDVVDVSLEFPESPQWLAQFGMVVMFNNMPPEATRAVALQFLRRAERGLVEYSMACKDVAEFLQARGSWPVYYRALYHFEATVGLLYQAYEFARKALATNFFKGNDGTGLDRLNKVNNAVKHVLAVTDQPVWITNDGIAAEGALIQFQELEDLLRSNARIATHIASGTAPTV